MKVSRCTVLQTCVPVLLTMVAFGCSKSPKAVFKELQGAAISRDPAAIWRNLSPEARADLSARAAELFREPAASAGPPSESEGREYLSSLARNLEPFAVEYIRTLYVLKADVAGDLARVSLSSLRFGPPEKPIEFRRVDGKWVWDCRETLAWYLEHRHEISNFAQGGM